MLWLEYFRADFKITFSVSFRGQLRYLPQRAKSAAACATVWKEMKLWSAITRSLSGAHVTRMARSNSQASSVRLPLTMDDVREAEERIRGHVTRTPVMTCSRLDMESGHSLFFKCELFQKTGSFKVSAETCVSVESPLMIWEMNNNTSLCVHACVCVCVCVCVSLHTHLITATDKRGDQHDQKEFPRWVRNDRGSGRYPQQW